MPTNSYLIAAIGPAELLSGLQAIGITMFPANDADTATAHLVALRSGDTRYACVCITERIALSIHPEILSGSKDTPSLPVILMIPDLQSTKDSGLEKLRELTKRAIGSDILG